MSWSYNPGIAVTAPVWAVPLFARHYLRNHFCFLFLRVLRCFSSPGLPPLAGYICLQYSWVAPFGYLRINCCADPRSFSQLITSFIASESQGIPHTPLVTFQP